LTLKSEARLTVGVAAPWEVGLRQRLVDRDHDALAECYDQYGTLVYAVALRTTANRAAAADVTQNVFLTLWTQPLMLDLARGTMRGWLARLSHNSAVDWVRSESARDRRERSDPPGPATPDLRDAFDAVLQTEQLRAALDVLPSDESIAIRLAYFASMTYQDVAIELGIPEGTAKSRIRGGLRRMAAALDSGLDSGASETAS
jgi:RNA polymerase sigma factor (sigma-70 family)